MTGRRKPVQVFIVEDSDPDVYLVEEALRSHGIEARIERCHDGEEALAALSGIAHSAIPDIIIIDLNLPRITGFEILKQVRGLQLLDRVPVLILTSSQSRTDRGLALQLGANAYIAKPPTLPEFLTAVGSGVRGLLERLDAGAGAPLNLEPRFAPQRISMRGWYCPGPPHHGAEHAASRIGSERRQEKLRQRGRGQRRVARSRARPDDWTAGAERRW